MKYTAKKPFKVKGKRGTIKIHEEGLILLRLFFFK